MKCIAEEIRKLMDDLECPSCKGTGHKAELCRNGPHFGKMICGNCGRHLDWIAMPKSESEEKRDRKHSRRYVTRLGEQRCEICLRALDELPGPEKIEVQHVIEKAAIGAAADEPGNYRLYCSACHSWVNWMRTHIGHYHLPKKQPA